MTLKVEQQHIIDGTYNKKVLQAQCHEAIKLTPNLQEEYEAMTGKVYHSVPHEAAAEGLLMI